MLDENTKIRNRSFVLLFLFLLIFAGYIGWNLGQSSLLTNLNERGELTCERNYCTLYLEGSDLEIGGVGNDFEISRVY